MDFKIPRDIMNKMTDVFCVERNGETLSNANGFFCGKNYPSTIQLVEDVDVREGDWLIHSKTGRRYFVIEACPLSADGKVLDWRVKYQSEFDWEKAQEEHRTASINIGSVSGPAIIGNQQTATLNVGCSADDMAKLLVNKPASDMATLVELISVLKDIESKDEPIPKGALSKFSDLLHKHSDLLIALGGWAAKLLTGQ